MPQHLRQSLKAGFSMQTRHTEKTNSEIICRILLYDPAARHWCSHTGVYILVATFKSLYKVLSFHFGTLERGNRRERVNYYCMVCYHLKRELFSRRSFSSHLSLVWLLALQQPIITSCFPSEISSSHTWAPPTHNPLVRQFCRRTHNARNVTAFRSVPFRLMNLWLTTQ